MGNLASFKYGMNQVVYNQKNQKRGRVIQRNRVVDTNYYLVRMEENADRVWLSEGDLDDKSLKDKLFEGAEGKYNTTATSSIWNSNYNDQVIELPYIPVQPTQTITFDTNQTIKYKTLTGMEAVDRIIYINEKIKELEEHLVIVRSIYVKHTLQDKLNELQEEHDRIAKQLNYLRITYQEVK